MKKRSFLSLLILLISASLILSSCEPKEAPATLEEFVSGEDIELAMEKEADDTGSSITINGNDIIYSYDISRISGFKDEVTESEAFIGSLTDDLSSQADIYSGTCRSLEEKTGLTGISLTVEYLNGSDVIISQRFTSSGQDAPAVTETPE